MRYETIIGKALLGQISKETAEDMTSALMVAQKYITCRHCGTILDCRRLGWLKLAGGGILPVSIACKACFDEALPRLQATVKATKIECKLVDSSALPWTKRGGNNGKNKRKTR